MPHIIRKPGFLGGTTLAGVRDARPHGCTDATASATRPWGPRRQSPRVASRFRRCRRARARVRSRTAWGPLDRQLAGSSPQRVAGRRRLNAKRTKRVGSSVRRSSARTFRGFCSLPWLIPQISRRVGLADALGSVIWSYLWPRNDEKLLQDTIFHGQIGVASGGHETLAMQKVVGSSPIIRFPSQFRCIQRATQSRASGNGTLTALSRDGRAWD